MEAGPPSLMVGSVRSGPDALCTAAGKPHRPLVFRREVEVGRNMKEARFYITARGVYEAAINGSGEERILGTDESWKWAYGPVESSELYYGEMYDFNAQLSEKLTWNEVKCQRITDNLVAPDGPPVGKTQDFVSRKILRTPLGKMVVDLGQNMVGRIRVSVDGPRGTAINFQFVEVLEDGEVVTRTPRDRKAKDTPVLPGTRGDGRAEWEPKFAFQGFRYVEVENWPGKLENGDIKGTVVHTDIRETGSFSCSSPLLNKLHEIFRWSMQGNFLNIPTDCPQRDERLGLTGGINAFADTANYPHDSAGMLSS